MLVDDVSVEKLPKMFLVFSFIQSSPMYGSGCNSIASESICGGASFLSPHSAFESSSDKLIESGTPTRGHMAHHTHINAAGMFSSISSTDGISPTPRYQ